MAAVLFGVGLNAKYRNRTEAKDEKIICGRSGGKAVETLWKKCGESRDERSEENQGVERLEKLRNPPDFLLPLSGLG